MSNLSSTVLQFKIEYTFLFNLFISAANSSTLFSIVFHLIFYSTLLWTKLIGIAVIPNIVTTVFTNPFIIHKVRWSILLLHLSILSVRFYIIRYWHGKRRGAKILQRIQEEKIESTYAGRKWHYTQSKALFFDQKEAEFFQYCMSYKECVINFVEVRVNSC